MGVKLILVAGVRLDAIDSTSLSLFQAQLAPSSLPGTQETSQETPGGFENNCIFFNFFGLGSQRWSNLLAVPRGRFAPPGDGSQCYNGVLLVIQCITLREELYMTSSCFMAWSWHWDPLVGPLPDWEGLGEAQLGLGMAFFALILELGWVYLGPWPANLGE